MLLGLGLQLGCYIDADWDNELDECKSTIGYAFLLNNGTITWNNNKQHYTTLSTMEVEYMICSVVV